RVELLGDVGRGHRAEELALVADASRKGERDLLQLVRESLRDAAALVLGCLEAITLELNALEIARRRFVREAAREQIVASVTGLDLHNVARLAEILDRLAENDFHDETPIEVGD